MHTLLVTTAEVFPSTATRTFASVGGITSSSCKPTFTTGSEIPLGALVTEIGDFGLTVNAHTLIACLNKLCEACMLGTSVADHKELVTVQGVFEE